MRCHFLAVYLPKIAEGFTNSSSDTTDNNNRRISLHAPGLPSCTPVALFFYASSSPPCTINEPSIEPQTLLLVYGHQSPLQRHRDKSHCIKEKMPSFFPILFLLIVALSRQSLSEQTSPSELPLPPMDFLAEFVEIHSLSGIELWSPGETFSRPTVKQSFPLSYQCSTFSSPTID